MMVGSPSESTRPSAQLLGMEISLLDMSGTLRQISEWMQTATTHLIVTADATSLVIAHDNPRFAEIMRNADLRTADGVGIVWALKRQGVKNVPKVSGVDLVGRLCELSAQHGWRLYFLGSAHGVTEEAADRLRLRYPGCNIAGTHHGYFPAESDTVVAEEIARAQPDILFVAMGMPRQEEFILATQDIIRAKVAMGVGGSFDVYSGRTRRAPRWVQAIRLEWLWRLILNPSKISKVKQLPRFVGLVKRAQRS
jgi:N-acetylglucosaminyldiphosphoundecaprenol N-acetyl-beta-D-mannosaminyltransferase